jgi:hypothetical protein
MEAATELHSMLVEQQEKAAKVEAAINPTFDTGRGF